MVSNENTARERNKGNLSAMQNDATLAHAVMHSAIHASCQFPGRVTGTSIELLAVEGGDTLRL